MQAGGFISGVVGDAIDLLFAPWAQCGDEGCNAECSEGRVRHFVALFPKAGSL